MLCLNCGGEMIGDGCTVAIHCEYVDLPLDRECDAEPLYCKFKDFGDSKND